MKTMLIVVDMLNDFICPTGALYVPGSEIIVPKIKALIQSHNRAGNCIVFLADSHALDDAEFERFPPHCVAATPGAAIIEVLLDGLDEVEHLTKTRFSGFYKTSLDSVLEREQPDMVEVVGVCTSICIMDTVGGLANRDIRTRVYKEAVADLPPDAFGGIDMNAAALKRMEVIYRTEIV